MADSIVSSMIIDVEDTLQTSSWQSQLGNTQQMKNLQDHERTKQTLTYNYKSNTLAQIDCEGKGEISIGMVRRAARQIKHLKRIIALLLLVAALLLMGIFAASYIAIEMSKEMHVNNSLLVDTSGHPVSTVQKLSSVEGVRSGMARRLSNSTSAMLNTSNMTGASSNSSISQNVSETSEADDYYDDLVIDSPTFYDNLEGYVTGRAPDWVVPLPDGTVRTISIQGSSARSAWGICGVCHLNLVWTVSCPEPTNISTTCPISWEVRDDFYDSGNTGRLLRGSEPGKSQETILSRATQARSEEFSESLDRSLTSKSCI